GRRFRESHSRVGERRSHTRAWKAPADAFRAGRIFQELLEGEFGAEFYSSAALCARDFAKVLVSKVSVRIIELRRVGYAEGLCTYFQAGSLGDCESTKDSRVKTEEIRTAE